MNYIYKYCPVCKEKLVEKTEGGYPRLKCSSCGFVHYRNPAPTAGVLVIEDGSVLLVKRRYEPYRGLWVMPSGYIEYGESAAETAVREVEEEAGVCVDLTSIHAVESCFDDPRGNTLMILYRGRITGGSLEAGDDADDAAFFPINDLPNIAFDAQKRILGKLKEEYIPAADRDD
ncbi:MAG TPA: NUDIX hydrolase [Candidatus Krumholzibacteriaceae bacterium]|nr:NUDIX hydrolase [Candidatus Krumholzibacteriaceae bacterium]